jgi:large subunit ribosomal protein L13
MMERRTWSPKLADQNVNRRWYIVDAEGKTLGRLATVIAATLRGKRKPTFTPHADMGDFVIVVNAEKVVLTGKKETQKLYSRHSGYPGGLRQRSVREVRASHPERLIQSAVRGMLPHNALGERQLRKLKVYAGPDHPHATQQPQPLQLERVAVAVGSDERTTNE